MFKEKKIKTKKVALFAGCIMMLGTTTAFAASYNFYFHPPFVGSIQYSYAETADGTLTPYVDPSGTTNATTYVLTMPEEGSTTTVSSFVTNVTSAKTYLTYNTGYGGAGQKYRLTGYPSNYDFQGYAAAGVWKP